MILKLISSYIIDMKFKKNLITVLVLINLLLILMIVLKKRKSTFTGRRNAAIIDNPDKNKIQIDSRVKVIDDNNDKLKNSELFINGDLEMDKNNLNVEPEFCIGDTCFNPKSLNELVSKNIPYEVFDTDDARNKINDRIPDKLCYNRNGFSYCINGDSLKFLNGNQPVYIAGPNSDKNDGSANNFKEEGGHLNYTIGPGSQYYYDINDNYYEKQGMNHKQNIGSYADPCAGNYWNRTYCDTQKILIRAQENDQQDIINQSGVNRVPYFYNINVLNDKPIGLDQAINIDGRTKICPEDDPHCNGDGILQMIKLPVHKKIGASHHFNDNDSHSHNGNNNQDNELMNIAAVNFLPQGFNGSPDSKNVRDKIKYILKPGEDTNLKCFSINTEFS